MITAEILEAVKKNEIKLPSPPTLLTKINEVLSNDNAGIHDLVKVIQTNHSVVARVLQVANSPAMRPTQPIFSLTEAVNRLGMQVIKNVVICVTLHDMFTTTNKELLAYLDKLWSHMTKVAAAATLLAPKFKLQPDVAMIAGLLHDIGQLPIVDYFAKKNIPTNQLDEVTAVLQPELSRLIIESMGFATSIKDVYKSSYEWDTSDSKVTYYDIISALHTVLDDMELERITKLGIPLEELKSLISTTDYETLYASLTS